MYISKVTYLDKEKQEADVWVSDGTHSVLCYLYPVDNQFVGQYISIIICFGCKNLQKSDCKVFQIKKLPSYYAYSVIAQVVSSQTVRVGDIIIQINENIPADITTGDFISFDSLRFDI